MYKISKNRLWWRKRRHRDAGKAGYFKQDIVFLANGLYQTYLFDGLQDSIVFSSHCRLKLELKIATDSSLNLKLEPLLNVLKKLFVLKM